MTERGVARVARWTGDGFRIAEEPVREPGHGEVEVALTACMVCVTEVHAVDGVIAFPIPEPYGHEFVGVVTAAGPGADAVPVGSLVAAAGSLGGFADAVVTEAGKLVVLPPGTPPEHGCFVEPLSACLKAVRRAAVPYGGTLLVTGAGTNGLLATQLALRTGAARVIVSEPDPERRARAGDSGAALVVDPVATPLTEALAGVRIDAVVETAGRLHALRDALAVVAEGGRVVMFGVQPTEARLDLGLLEFHLRDASLISSMGYTRADVESVVGWLPDLRLEGLVTHRFELADLDAAFDVARTGTGLKALVQMSR